MGRHEGKVAVITGGSSGIGLATAKLLTKEGAHVFITGRRRAQLDAAVKEIGETATGVQGDAASLTDLDRLYATVKQQKGHIDILFASAGTGAFAPLGSITEEHFDTAFDTNVRGLLFTVQKALPLFRDGGAVVLNGSIVSSKGGPAISVYSATKAAVRSFARCWTIDLKDRKIRVNVVSPGSIDTPGLDAFVQSSGNAQAVKDALISRIPMGRLGTPNEIANAVSFIASDDASFVTGVEFFVDGGTAQV